MAWEYRNSNMYYYRYEWVNGQAKKIYCGTGFRARAAAEEDKAKRERRKLHAWEVNELKRELAGIVELTKQARETAATLVEAYLISDGYYRASYVWRKRKRTMIKTIEKETKTKAPAKRKAGTKRAKTKKAKAKKSTDCDIVEDKKPRKVSREKPEAALILDSAIINESAKLPLKSWSPNGGSFKSPLLQQLSGENNKEKVVPTEGEKIGDGESFDGIPQMGPDTSPQAGSLESKLQILQQLARAANSGSKDAIQQLNDYLVDNPEIQQQNGDIARLVRRGWALAIGGANKVQVESVFIDFEQKQKEIDADTTLCRTERVLLSQILLNEMHVSCCSLRVVTSLDDPNGKLRAELAVGQEFAQKQLYRSIDCLANFRKASRS